MLPNTEIRRPQSPASGRPRADRRRRGPGGPGLALLGLFLLVLSIPGSALRAQDAAGSAPAPQVRGSSDENAFDFSDVDAVNLMNGNLTLAIPLGATYPAGGELSYGFELRYNANAWDWMENCVTTVDPGGQGPPPGRTIWDGVPDRMSNAGMGWSLHFGRILTPQFDLANPGRRLTYVAPDGSRHAFYDELRPGYAPGGRYTRDGTYIRWQESPAGCFDLPDQPTDGCEVELEFADGTVHTLRDVYPDQPFPDFRTVSIEDRFGNAVHIDYRPGTQPVDSSSRWTVSDGFGRVHEVEFADGRHDLPLVPTRTVAQLAFNGDDLPQISSIKMEAFGGGAAEYRLIHAEVPVARHNRQYECTPAQGGVRTDAVFTVPHLVAIDQPAGDDDWAFGYYVSDDPDGAKSGSLRNLRLPTGGGFAWTYGLFGFLESAGATNPENITVGVREKMIFLDAGDIPAADTSSGVVNPPLDAAAADGVWTYSHERSLAISPWDGGSPNSANWTRPCFYATTVVDPAGTAVKSYFVGAREGFHRAGSLPFTPCGPTSGKLFDVDDDGTSDVPFNPDSHPLVEDTDPPEYFLSKEVFAADGTRLRRELLRYEYDPFPGVPPHGFNSPKTRDYNPRIARKRTEYWDDLQGSENGSSGPPHETWMHWSDFDGFGHFRHEERRSTFGAGGDQDLFTNYNPVGCTTYGDPCPADQRRVLDTDDPWVLETSRWSLVTQDPDLPGRRRSRAILTDFDAATGFLEGQRLLADASGAGDHDVLRCFTADPSGHPIFERHYGGDGQDVGGVDGCPAGGLTPVYARSHSYSGGVLERSFDLAPDGQPFLLLTDRTLDPGTGLPSRETGPDGFGVNSRYDARGRLVSRWRDEGATECRSYLADLPAGHTVTVEERAPSAANCAAGGAAMTFARQVYDGLGRLAREDLRLPTAGGSALATREHTHDILGRQLTLGLWTNASSSAPTDRTDFLDYDAFGRAAAVRRPDGGVTSTSFFGDRWIETREDVATGTGGAGTETSVRREFRNGLGRIVKIEESRAPGVRMPTTFAYDPAGLLTDVCINDLDGDDWAGSCPEPVGQRRSFDIDGRGFRVGHRQPERDRFSSPAGVWSARHGYDAGGQVIWSDFDEQAFDLTYRYDPARRLTQVLPDGSNAPWKEYFFTRGDAVPGPGTRLPGAGRLFQTKRHHGAAAGGPSASEPVVTETFFYNQRGGEVSAYRVRSSDGPSFESRIDRLDPRFDIERLAYPRCDRPPCEGLGGPPGTAGERLVDFTYADGLVTAAPGFVDDISYHWNGDLDRLLHSNGAVESTRLDASGWRLRGISVTDGGATLWDTGDYGYDPAGNLRQIGADVFAYDLLGRLVRADLHFEGETASQTVGYDNFANISSLVNGGAAPPGPGTLLLSPSTNRVTGASFEYDSHGNAIRWPLGGVEFTATFDPFDRQQSLQSAGVDEGYLYTAGGERFATVDRTSGEVGYTPRAADHQVLRRYRSVGGEFSIEEDYVHAAGRAVASIDADGEVTHLHVDHLGSTRLVTRATPAGVEVVESHKYLPLGGALRPPQPGDQALQFTGHERDAHGADARLALDYMHARYYAPYFGRFLSVDPVILTEASPSQLWNRYSYAGNDPLGAIDPDGEAGLGLLKKGIKVAFHGGDLAATFAGVIDDFNTVTDSEASLGRRVLAGVSLLTEVASPISARDVGAAVGFTAFTLKKGDNFLRTAVDGAIGSTKTLQKISAKIGHEQKRAAHNLIRQLLKGNNSPGIRNTPIGHGMTEARARNGARVAFRIVGDKVIIEAIFDKNSQDRAINLLKEIKRKERRESK
ncbi:MAG: RHS repeat-associated core domain-containing protein [Acidobacteriota bacterium]